MGLDKPALEPKEKPIKKTPAIKKRNLPETSADDDEGKPLAKAQRVESDSTSGVRRSSRQVARTLDRQKEEVSAARISFSSDAESSEDSEPPRRQTKHRKYDPLAFFIFFINASLLTPNIHSKTYGSIPGIEVGTWWETRQECSADSIHAYAWLRLQIYYTDFVTSPWVGGISGGPNGAYSVALSGGYEDDVDLGYAL